MSVTTGEMVNENFVPDEDEEAVLEHMKDGREACDPWGFTSASIAAVAIGTHRQATSDALGSLHDAGWVERVEPAGTGVYRFVEDPREDDDE